MSKYEGYNGQLALDLEQGELTLTREGLVAKTAKGERTRALKLSTLSGVRLEPATRLMNGHIALGFHGDPAPVLGKNAAASHPDAVTFMHKKQELFAELHARLSEIVESNAALGFEPNPAPPAAVTSSQASPAPNAATTSKMDKSAARLQNAHEKYSGGGARPDIAEAAARMSWTFGGKRELKKLVEHVQDDEVVSFIAQGTYQTNQGIVVLTDQRLLFVFHGFTSAVVEDFPLRSITNVASKKGMTQGTLIVHVAGAATHISNVVNADLGHLLDALRLAVKAGQNPQQIVMQQAPAPIDVADQLSKLAALRDQGILNDDEFAAQKAKLLA